APATWRALARRADRRRSRRSPVAAAANTPTGSPSPRARKDAPAASRTDIVAPEPLFRRISYASGVFFTLAMHLRALTNLPLRRLHPLLGPTAQRLPSQQTHLLHQALFRSVGFRQFPLRAFDRQQGASWPPVSPALISSPCPVETICSWSMSRPAIDSSKRSAFS